MQGEVHDHPESLDDVRDRHQLITEEGTRLRNQQAQRARVLWAPENEYPAHMLRPLRLRQDFAAGNCQDHIDPDNHPTPNADFLTWMNDATYDPDNRSL